MIPRRTVPDPGIGQAARGAGATVDGTGWEAGGATGLFARARWLLHPGLHGGTAGSLGPAGGSGTGGGALTILARLDLTNRGMIEADADAGNGGGAGGGGGRINGTTPGDAAPGSDGALFVTLADPTSMF